MTRTFILQLFIAVMLMNVSAQDAPTSISQPELTVYKAPAGAPANNTYAVYVKYDGGEWIDLHEYDAGVDGGYEEAPIGHMSFVLFDADFSKRIDVKVEKNEGTINEVKIRLASAGVAYSVDGNTLTLSLIEAKKLTVEINGDLLNNLMLFADSLETDIPDSTDSSVHYFGPGIHKLGGDGKGTLSVKSNETVYIAGGAIVYGHIEVKDPSYQPITNVKIKGRGILSGDMLDGHPYNDPAHAAAAPLISFNVVNDAEIEGIILHNTVKWNIHLHYCLRIKVKDLKIMGWTINSDGIDPQVSSDILIDDCFVRNFDDCVSIKLSWSGGGIQDRGARNITVQNCVFWTDQGRAVLIGPEMASTNDKVIENITVRNLDILYTENYSADWAKGVLSINGSDDATVKDVLYEDIRVDTVGNMTNLVTINMSNPYGKTACKRVENIRFNRLTLNSDVTLDNYIQGFDAEHMVSGVTFTDLIISGSYINNAAQGRFNINDYAENIEFAKTTQVDNKQGNSPLSFRLMQNYPNPFNPSTTIVYELDSPAQVSLSVYNMLGKQVKILVDKQQNANSEYRVIWNGKDEAGNDLSSGVYYVQLKAGGITKCIKMLKMK